MKGTTKVIAAVLQQTYSKTSKKTSQPLFSEAAGEKMILLFLDWEKAFDKVDQHELLNAISRLNIPEKIMRILKGFYMNPSFRVKDREGKSEYRKQRSGIRQGCPLSPYLFILLMTVMFHDVHEKVDRLVRRNIIACFNTFV